MQENINQSTAADKLEENTDVEKKKMTVVPAHIPSPVKAYTQNRGKARASSLAWEQPEWDLAECGRILDTESYVRRAFRAKKNLWLKEGYSFTGPNPQRVEYTKKRILQMEQATKIGFPILMSQILWSLIRTHNAFLVKVRDEKRSGGRVRKVKKKELKPVAGYFIMPAETVRFKRDENGNVVKYQQSVYGKKDKEFLPEDVVHFYLDKREGFSVGTPALVSVKDDIRALRRIEENVELLVYQHLFPLFHYKVGTPDMPAEVLSNGQTEVDIVQAAVQRIPSDGCWVTPERHSIEVLGAEGNALAVDNTIAHFKQRIFTGLGVSSVDMGEGGTANRSTAQTMSRNLIDDTKADQREFGAIFYSEIIQEIMLESTFDQKTLFDEENKVVLKFKEIDFESRMAKENHYVDIFLKNGITHPEMRIAMGYEPFEGAGWPTGTKKSQVFKPGSGDWAQTNHGLIERDKIILQSLDEPGTPASQAEAKSRTTANKTKPAGGKSIENKNKPANQTGSRPSAKINKDNAPRSLDIIFLQDPPLERAYLDLQLNVVDIIKRRGVSLKQIRLSTDIAFTHAKDKLVSLAQRAYRIGIQDTNTDFWRVRLDKADEKIQGHIEKFVYKLRDELLDAIKRNTIRNSELRNEDAVFTDAVFNSMKHRTRMIDNSEIMRAYNFGNASGYRIHGFNRLSTQRTGLTSCDTCDNHILSYVETDVIIYNELPPFHPHCTCRMKRE